MSYDTFRKHYLLNAQEEVELTQQIEAARLAPGDVKAVRNGHDAHRRMVESNLRLAMKMARKHRAPDHVDREDMIQDAMIGLERAVEDFDWRRGYRFSTYASWWIRQAIQTGLEQTAGSVRIPAHRSQELHAALHQTNGNLSELSPRLGATMVMASMSSLDAPMAGDGAGLGERVAAGDVDPLDHVILANDRLVVHELVATLDDTNRYLVSRRFGLGGNDPATFTELAQELGVSPEAARRRVIRALKRLEPAAAALAA
ncbi:MAG: RNA polymerase primary sigma factor [Paracrocinitomix sp.]|jgi:RNA polymerase primary sigma factor